MDLEIIKEGLLAAKKAIEDTSQARSSADDFAITRCHHCDEFMMEAAWPNHASPNCPIAPAWLKIEAALKELGLDAL